MAPQLSDSTIFAGFPGIKVGLIEGRRSLSQLKENPGKPGLSTNMQMSEPRKLHPQLKCSALPTNTVDWLPLTVSSGSYIM